MLIEIYSDTVCPWCFIGKRRLERALDLRPEVQADIRWKTFQLNPWMPPEGMDRAEYLVAKFGQSDAGRIYENIRRVGAAEDLAFDFSAIRHTPNTLQSHRLVRFAQREGFGDAVVESLFRAYFLDGRDIGDDEVIVDVAVSAGLDAERTRVYLASEEDAEDVRGEDAAARRMGIQGVPCFIVNGSYAISGAQEPEYFLPLFDLISSGAAEQDAAD